MLSSHAISLGRISTPGWTAERHLDHDTGRAPCELCLDGVNFEGILYLIARFSSRVKDILRALPRNEQTTWNINNTLLIGSGPIIIGQACEFDYSGTQACKALREEGYEVVLVNSNPATIMTDPNLADRTYIEPLTWEMVAKVIEVERPDALLPTLGGQTALNIAMALAKHGVLEKFNCEMIGAKPEVIDKAEARDKFKAAMEKIGLEVCRGETVHDLDHARANHRRYWVALRGTS